MASTFIFRAYFIIGKTFRNFMGIAAWNQSFHNVSISFASEQLFPLGQSSISCKSHGSTQDSASKGEHEVHH